MNKRMWVLFLLLTATPLFAGVGGDLRKGGRFYKQGKYGQALSAYQHALLQNPQDAQAALGAGASAYYLKDYALAQKAFEQAAQDERNPRRQDALFNLGNTHYRAGQNDQAKESYRQAILQNPQDREAIHNLQLLLQNEQNQNNQNNQNQQNQDENSSNQDKQDSQKNQGQSPQEQQNQEKQPQPQPNQMQQDDADRVMQIARDNEFKQHAPKNPGRGGEEEVEKDW